MSLSARPDVCNGGWLKPKALFLVIHLRKHSVSLLSNELVLQVVLRSSQVEANTAYEMIVPISLGTNFFGAMSLASKDV